MSLIDGPENTNLYEYSVLITDRKDLDLPALFHHYRDRADCENNFDELKNQWGWGGYTTQDVKSCRLMSRMIALIYNWWNLYTRLAFPDQHHEAITTRPLLLSSVDRQTTHANKKTITVTSAHGKSNKLVSACNLLTGIFDRLKAVAPQLSPSELWKQLLQIIIDHFEQNRMRLALQT